MSAAGWLDFDAPRLQDGQMSNGSKSASNPEPIAQPAAAASAAAASAGNGLLFAAGLDGSYASDADLRGRIPDDILDRYEVHQWKHAAAILKTDFPDELADIVAVLREIRLPKSAMLAGGGGKSQYAKAIDAAFCARGWVEKSFSTEIVVDGVPQASPTHKVDCFKNRIALELEWNNKDPFYDRDLNNFRLLFELRAISVGVIVTKSLELKGLFEELDIWEKYGTSTTWMSKLTPRIKGGGGGGCPLLVFGIRRTCVTEE